MLIDVDGVLSLWGFDPNRRPAGSFTSVEGVVHFLSEEAARHLLSVVSDFDPVWCTGWEEKANEHLPSVLGLGPFPFVSFDAGVWPSTTTPGHWKLGAIEFYANDRPLAWIDDAFNEACHEWACSRSAPTLLVPTEPAVGVEARHAAELRSWAASLPSMLTGDR